MLARPVWSREELEAARAKAMALFRQQRMLEPLEHYLNVFDEYQGVIEDLLERTVDLTELPTEAAEILVDPQAQEVLRYLTGPPISADDLKVVAEASLSAQRVRNDAEMVQRIVQVIRDGLDRRRFPWVTEVRDPSEAERTAAILASAALIAMRKTETARRGEGQAQQEQQVKEALLGTGFVEVPRRTVMTMSDAPHAGEFCGESQLSGRKADYLVGLYDGRLMPVECKVSNSSTNSIKRLNNDAAVKANVWIREMGENHVVPAAVLSGVYKLRNLTDAQRRGLTIFWAHELDAMVKWINDTRESRGR
jgi:hypothetical protein